MKNKYSGRKYQVVPYNQSWIEKQINLAEENIRSVLGKAVLEIHHVGSTAVPGLNGKPTIDVLVIVRSVEEINSFQNKIKESGFEVAKDYIAPQSWLLFKNKNNERVLNVHLLETNHPEIHRMISIRDYLRTHEGERKEYGKLKEELARKYPDNYEAYRREKDHFLEALINKI